MTAAAPTRPAKASIAAPTNEEPTPTAVPVAPPVALDVRTALTARNEDGAVVGVVALETTVEEGAADEEVG